MKINRFIALALIALLVLGAMGFITARGLARGFNPHLQQVVATQAPDTGNSGDQVGNQGAADTDTDNVEDQVGDQGAADTDTNNTEEQVGDQNGPENVDQGSEEQETGAEIQDSTEITGTQEITETQEISGTQELNNETSDNETDQSVLQSQAVITVEQAQQAALAANRAGTILNTDLDDENGALVYSVEFTGGIEVKVDAMTGTVLATENWED